MSKELDKIKECLDFFCRRCNEQGFYSPPLQPIVKEAYEAIATLRSEPVAWSAHGIKREDTCVWVQDSDGPWNTSCGKVFEFTNEGPAENEANFCYHCGGALLPEPYSDAAPSRETATEVPVHSKSQYKRVAAQGGNPVLSRETEQRESSGIRIEGSQSPGSNPAPMHGQSKTGLTESHSGAPTLQRSEAEQESKGSGSPLIAPAQSSDHPTAEPALSAEHIEQIRRAYDGSKVMDSLCRMALSSLTARDEGIEAAAKILHEPWASAVRALKGASHD